MKILIIEDELIIAEDIKIIVKLQKHKITSIVSSCEEAIKSIEKERPDVIFLDIGLKSKINGIQSAKIIYEKYKIRVIYMTSFFQKIPDDAQLIKPYAFLIKPVVQEEILQALHKVKNDQENIHTDKDNGQYFQETYYSQILNY